MDDSWNWVVTIRPQFQRKIIEWYEKNGRKFQWRSRGDPYSILLAEILLRLTGAWKVEEAFEKITSRYPSLEFLSKASVEELEELMEPLGLHWRAKGLVKIAEEIVEKFDGKVPQNYDDLISIKGIGKYTGNAVLCFSYGKRKPIVDGSIKRIFCRCFGYRSEKEVCLDDEIWSLAEKFLPKRRYVEYNYGLLDFGAKVCTHAKPKCGSCPLEGICIS